MNIAIIGSSGFVGMNLFYKLAKKHKVYGISRTKSATTTNQADITHKEIGDLLSRIKPDIIIHSAKLREGADYYETHKEEAERVEIRGAMNLVEWTAKYNKKFILISTDYVYEGKTNNYDESSETRPVNFYGLLKLKLEEIVSQNVKDYAILRPTVIFGYLPGDTNFLMQIINAKEKRRIPHDQISNPTDIRILCDYVDGVIKKEAKGLYVATGEESLSRYEFTQKIAKVFNKDMGLFQPVSTEELNPIAKRPLKNRTDSSKIRNYLNYNCPRISDSLISIK